MSRVALGPLLFSLLQGTSWEGRKELIHLGSPCTHLVFVSGLKGPWATSSRAKVGGETVWGVHRGAGDMISQRSLIFLLEMSLHFFSRRSSYVITTKIFWGGQ